LFHERTDQGVLYNNSLLEENECQVKYLGETDPIAIDQPLSMGDYLAIAACHCGGTIKTEKATLPQDP
jgi:hypothetical protein